MKKEKIPTLIGLTILIIGILSGVFLIKSQTIFRLGASAEQAPKDVRISNISDSSFTVSWTTDKETIGFVKWGKNINNLDKVGNDTISQKGYTHSSTIKSLNPQTEYFFKINSDSKDYDNQDIAWKVKTGPQLGQPANNVIISGNILSQDGTPVKNALVYFSVSGGSTLSTVTSKTGNWLMPISQTRNKNLESYITIDENSSLVEISVNAGINSVSSAQIYPRSAKPAPTIILKEVNDFKNLGPSKDLQAPNASFEMPEGNISSKSGFEIEENTSKSNSKIVTLDSHNEGEMISNQNPEFFGIGPAGFEIEIQIESEIQTDKVTIGNSGTWKWSPSEELEEGVHKITIKWRDVNGILRTITRNFTVQASEFPAFVSTPSATPKFSPVPSPIPEKTTTTYYPEISEQPVSGISTYTLLTFTIGVAIFLISFILGNRQL